MVLPALLLSLACPLPAYQVEALPLRTAQCADAWTELSEGCRLRLRRTQGESLDLGDGYQARFDAAGNLHYRRRFEFMNTFAVEQDWVVLAGADRAQRTPAHLAVPAVTARRPRPLPTAAGAALRICIDPGHGGVDPGGVGQGFEEAPLALDVSLRLRDLLLADTQDTSGGGTWEVLMTRTEDVTVSLGARVNLANAWPADRFVSIHINAFSNPAANGTETFSFSEGTLSANLRDFIQEEMIAAWGLTDRGSKTAGFFVLANTIMPATLSELGFITSPIDIVPLTDPEERQRAAEAHLFAIQRHFGFAPYLPSSNPATYCTAKVNSNGCLPVIGWEGTPTVAGADDFAITADEMVPGQFGVLFWGQSSADLPFGGGTLCVAPPLTRTPPQQATGVPGSLLCDGSYRFELTQAYMVMAGLAPGDVIFAQWWARDPALLVDKIGLSDGLRVLIE